MRGEHGGRGGGGEICAISPGHHGQHPIHAQASHTSPEQSSSNEQRALFYAVRVRLGPLKQRQELDADIAHCVGDAGRRAAAVKQGRRGRLGHQGAADAKR